MTELTALTEGDERALEELIAETAPALRRYCAGIMLSYGDAEDALQETYFRFWRSRGTLREPNRLLPFLYRIAYRACVDMLRARRLFRAPEPVRPAAEPGLSPALRAALKKLSPLDRALLLQRALEERSYFELSELYGKSEAALRKRYERARRRAAALLTEEKEDLYE